MDLIQQRQKLENIVKEGAPSGEGCTEDDEDDLLGEGEVIVLNIRCMRRLKARVALSKIADNTYEPAPNVGKKLPQDGWKQLRKRSSASGAKGRWGAS